MYAADCTCELLSYDGEVCKTVKLRRKTIWLNIRLLGEGPHHCKPGRCLDPPQLLLNPVYSMWKL